MDSKTYKTFVEIQDKIMENLKKFESIDVKYNKLKTSAKDGRVNFVELSNIEKEYALCLEEMKQLNLEAKKLKAKLKD